MTRYAVLWMALACGIAALAGCQTTKAPETPYAQWTPPQPMEADATWMILRNKAVAGQPLGVADLLNLAVQNNPSLSQYWQTARSADAAQLPAQSLWYPGVNLSGQAGRQRSNNNTLEEAVDTSYYGPNLTLNWLLLDLGGRSGGIEQARQTLLAANFQFNKAFQDLLLNVENAYFSLYSAESAVAAALDDMASSSNSLDAARQKLDAGLGTQLDVLQAQSDYDNSLYKLENARGSLKNAQGSLAAVVGLPADVPLDISDPATNMPPPVSSNQISQIINESLAMRPDVASERALVKSKAAAIRTANSALWPTLNLGSQAQRNWYRYGTSGMEDNSPYTYSGYLSLNWNIFDGFSNLGKKRMAVADYEAEVARLMAIEMNASLDVWTSYHNYVTALQKLVFSQAYLENTRAAYDLALQSYHAGLNSILDLLNAQSNQSTARSQLVQTQKEVYIALATLAHAMGTLAVPE